MEIPGEFLSRNLRFVYRQHYSRMFISWWWNPRLAILIRMKDPVITWQDPAEPKASSRATVNLWADCDAHGWRRALVVAEPKTVVGSDSACCASSGGTSGKSRHFITGCFFKKPAVLRIIPVGQTFPNARGFFCTLHKPKQIYSVRASPKIDCEKVRRDAFRCTWWHYRCSELRFVCLFVCLDASRSIYIFLPLVWLNEIEQETRTLAPAHPLKTQLRLETSAKHGIRQ